MCRSNEFIESLRSLNNHMSKQKSLFIAIIPSLLRTNLTSLASFSEALSEWVEWIGGMREEKRINSKNKP